MPYEQHKPASSILDSKPDTYQGSVSPHSVMVKHINAVLAAEHRHMVEYQREREQHEAERRARHARERAEMAAQGYIPPVILSTTEALTDHDQTHNDPKDADMNLKQFAAAAAIASSLTTSACNQEVLNQPTHNSAGEKIVTGEAFDITKNPNPQKAYKLKVKIRDAPGNFGYVGALASFRITNLQDCGFQLSWPNGDTVPGLKRYIKLPLTQLSESEYEGTFYTDWGKDGNFFDNGVCYWELSNVSVTALATGADGETKFINGLDSKAIQDNIVDTAFYLNDGYPTIAKLPNYPDYGITKDVVKKHHKPEAIFSITLTTEKIL